MRPSHLGPIQNEKGGRCGVRIAPTHQESLAAFLAFWPSRPIEAVFPRLLTIKIKEAVSSRLLTIKIKEAVFPRLLTIKIKETVSSRLANHQVLKTVLLRSAYLTAANHYSNTV